MEAHRDESLHFADMTNGRFRRASERIYAANPTVCEVVALYERLVATVPDGAEAT